MSNEISSQNIYLLYRNKMTLARVQRASHPLGTLIKDRRVASLTDRHKHTCYTKAYKRPEKAPRPTPL